jgi:hypothetical protein
MKIRTSFVSNSSSSSFVIAYKGDLDQILNKRFSIKVSKRNPLAPIVNDLVKTINDSIDKDRVYDSLEEYLQKFECKDLKELLYSQQRVAKLLKKGYKVVEGGFVDEYEGTLSSYLCNQDFDYKSKDLVWYQDGGY